MKPVFVIVLGVLVCWSAMQMVVARHESRHLFVALQKIEKQRDHLLDDWGRLQLEQATWGTHSRIEEVAREKLEMKLPINEHIELVSGGQSH